MLQKENSLDLVCPECKSALVFIREFNSYKCLGCNSKYPVIDSIPYLIKDIDNGFKAFQKEYYEDLAVNQGMSRYDPNRDGSLSFSVPKNFVDMLDRDTFDSFGFFKDEKVLDIGCNFGKRLNQLAAGYNIKGAGIDISLQAIKLAKEIKHPSNRYYVCDAEKLPFQEASFDRVISFGSIEHFPHPEKCIKEISRVIKRKGRILIATVNKNDRFTLHWLVNSLSFGMFGKESRRCLTHHADYFLDTNDMQRMLEENRFKLIKVLYSHSFFVLIYDEIIYPCLLKIYKLWHDLLNIGGTSESTKCRKEGKKTIPPIFKPYARILAILYQAAKFLDNPWTKQGFSYYLYVIAEKE